MVKYIHFEVFGGMPNPMYVQWAAQWTDEQNGFGFFSFASEWKYYDFSIWIYSLTYKVFITFQNNYIFNVLPRPVFTFLLSV